MIRREVGAVQAVDGVSFEVRTGETLGLVGESGCGKSTLGRCLVRLHELTARPAHASTGRDISHLDRRELRPLRREMQMVFQDPYASLNPRKRVGAADRASRSASTARRRREAQARVQELMEVVGLAPEHSTATRTSSRAASGSASAWRARWRCSPRLIVADEPVSALDVSIQAQVVNLLDDLQDEFSLTYVFIAHDLGVVRHVSDRIAVMYLGKIVELAPAEELYARPIHPYTEALLSAVPIPDPDRARASASCSRATCRARSRRRRLPLPPALPLCDRDLLDARSRRSSRMAARTWRPATTRSTSGWTHRRCDESTRTGPAACAGPSCA